MYYTIILNSFEPSETRAIKMRGNYAEYTTAEYTTADKLILLSFKPCPQGDDLGPSLMNLSFGLTH